MPAEIALCEKSFSQLFVLSDERAAVNVCVVRGGMVGERPALELEWVFRE
jgi:hypothetical protein